MCVCVLVAKGRWWKAAMWVGIRAVFSTCPHRPPRMYVHQQLPRDTCFNQSPPPFHAPIRWLLLLPPSPAPPWHSRKITYTIKIPAKVALADVVSSMQALESSEEKSTNFVTTLKKKDVEGFKKVTAVKVEQESFTVSGPLPVKKAAAPRGAAQPQGVAVLLALAAVAALGVVW